MAQDSIKRLYVQNVDDWLMDLSTKRFSDEELGVQVIEHGIVLPARRKIDKTWQGGVCDEDFNFIAGYSRKKNNEGGFASVLSAYTVDKSELVELDEDVIFGGTLIGHFGHFMLECLSRLWYVLQQPELHAKILFITTEHGGYKPWFEDFFRLMGIDKDRIIYVDKPIQCRSITVPEQAYHSNRFTKEFFVPYQVIKSRVTPAAPKKLYLTRLGFEFKKHGNVHCFNEQYFEDFFAKHGFEIVSMEKLSFDEQVSLIMGADEIAAIMGTLTHWALFCKPNAKFITLLRTHDLMQLQTLVTEATPRVEYHIVDTSKNFLYANRSTGVCLLGSTKYWKEFVADYFDEQIDEDDDSSYFNVELDKYIDFWCKKYVKSDNLNTLVNSLRDMCNRIITLERERIQHRPLLTYQTHVDKFGWGTWISENQFSNPINQQRDIQAIKINFAQPFHDVFYSVYYNETEGWSQEVSNGEMAGTTGLKKSIFGIKIRLDDSGANEFDILYRVHNFDGVWSPWAKNGELLYAHEVKLNALQIKLQSK